MGECGADATVSHTYTSHEVLQVGVNKVSQVGLALGHNFAQQHAVLANNLGQFACVNAVNTGHACGCDMGSNKEMECRWNVRT